MTGVLKATTVSARVLPSLFLRPAGVQAKLCYFPIDSGAGLIDVNPALISSARI
jgi:hypothetical protein